jgi:hypothetical protein
MPVGFYKAFIGTVRAEDALPSGGETALLTGFSQEVWGLPVSRPTRDAQDPNVVLLRWERGVMVWSRSTGSVTAIPLGETFRQVLTGDGLGPERTAAAAGSPFLMQVKTASPNGVARPGDLPNTVLSTAFTAGNPSINAAQLSSDPYGTQTPTPTSPVAAQTNLNPPPPPPPAALATVTPTLAGAIGAVPPPPGAVTGGSTTTGAVAAAPTGTDACYHDEQITFAPAEPRVNNEVLIAVTSSRPHPYGRLAGTEKTTFVRERTGQLGYVWEWTVALSYPGRQKYTFYVDSTVPCKEIELTVRQALTTPTQTPTKTATPWGWDNGNSNNNNNNSNGNSNDNGSSNLTYPRVNAASYFTNPPTDMVNCVSLGSQYNAQQVLRYGVQTLLVGDPNLLDSEDGVIDGVACSTFDYGVYSNDDDTTPVVYPAITPTPVFTPTPISTPTRAQRVPGAACNDPAFNFTGLSAQQFLFANPTDPLRMDESRDGKACGGADGAGFMNPPLYTGTPMPPPYNYR